MQGPGPVNIGGTGRRGSPRKQRKSTAGTDTADREGQNDGYRRMTGRQGEDMALEYLLQAGYRLLERNWHCSHKEVDLIMEGSDGLHIVEVRTRREPAAVEPEQTVDRWKQHNLIAAAGVYLKMSGRTCPVHFDIVSIVLDSSGRVLRGSHITDAFLPLGT